MMTKEEYKREIARMFDSIRDDKYKGYYECSGVQCCERCALYDIDCGSSTNAFEMIEAVEKWSKEHPQKHKISKLEYDIMRAAIDYSSEEETFKDVDILYELLEGGYFNGAKSNDKIVDYIEKCEVTEDD